MKIRIPIVLAALLATLAPATRSLASFHFMQIEQAIGGVGGDTTLQAVQLRMRTSFQNVLSAAKLWVRDASGNNPVLLKDFQTNVSNAASGSRVLIASADFAAQLDASVTPDYVFDNLIPDAYLAGGTMTFENSTGSIIYWRLSWGTYSGPTTGSVTNDADGDFGGPVPGALPSDGVQALLFQGSASDPSTTNESDYAVTPGASTWTNNAGDGGTLVEATECAADVNGDTTVDIDDLLLLLADWGPCPAPCPSDSTGDGQVTIEDLLDLLAAWGPCP